uniref:At1g61320/AtMIF1 LRR domain-containing protein n=1 Tax=Oryza rufipogon TaxID=4529 RepID=A0A0E0N8L8_ORYRU
MSSVAVQREQRWQNLALAPALPMSKPQLPLPPSPVSDKSNCTVGSTNNSPSEQVGHGDSLIYSLPYLPEDIWRHIHSLMPMSAAARAACLSHSFLNSWRFHPNLSLNFKTLCPRTSRGNFKCKIDSILRNHLGTAKILKLNVADEDSTYPYIDRWLEVAVTPGIEELTLTLHKKYIFACSLLSDGVRDSIRCLQLTFCAFHPMAELGPLRSLTKLHLCGVHITGDELESLLLNSLVLEQLRLNVCNKISFLKIPCVLQHLSCLSVMACRRMQVIVCEAPNLSSISLSGGIKFSLGETLTMKVLSMIRPNVVCQDDMAHESIIESSSPHLRQLPELSHDCLKSVKILGFNSAKSLVELTCGIVKAAVSLERLVLDTLRGGDDRCCGESNGKICWPVSNAVLKESARAAIAVRRYIEDKVSPITTLTLVEPCTRFKRHGGEEAMGLGGGRNRKEGGWVREGDVEETWGWMGMVQSAMVAQAKAETRSSGRTSLEQSGETTGWVTKVLELGIDWGGRSQAFILQELSVLDVAGNAEAWQHAARLDASVEKHHANMHTIW